jgi:hypothetical protein
MEYVFNAEAEALRDAGQLEPVISKTGEVLPLLKNPETGEFVVAKGVSNSSEIGTMIEITKAVVDFAQPLICPAEIIAGVVAQAFEKEGDYTAVLNGLSSIQSSLGVLQASTALIGVGTVGGVVLSAVNLRQTLKLRQDVKEQRLEVKNGLIDLKSALQNQGLEVMQRLGEVAEDIKFNQHRLELSKAYGRFLEASKLMKIALSIEDLSTRNGELANIRQTLGEAVSIYNNPHLLEETSAAGYLRRVECAWAIEQAIVISYQLQKETAATSDRLSHLQEKIRQDSLAVIDRCETEEELDFLFPERTRIHDGDLAVLELWKNQIDWMRSLSPSEQEMLANADFSDSEILQPSETNTATITQEKLPEELLYERLKEKSHPASLIDQLRFLMEPELRREYESYISEQAAAAGYKTLVPSNLEKASNMAVANLFYYLQLREESEEEVVAV